MEFLKVLGLVVVSIALCQVAASSSLVSSRISSSTSSVKPVKPWHEDIAWWKLEENSGTTATDSSGNGIDGRFVGQLHWSGGLEGVEFGGNGKIVVETPMLVWVIHAWIKLPPTNDTVRRMIFTNDDTSGRYLYMLQIEGGRILLTLPSTDRNFTLWSSIKIDDGKWHFVVAGRDDQYARMYLDIGFRYSTPINMIINSTGPAVLGGSYQCGSQQNFIGNLRGIRVFGQLPPLPQPPAPHPPPPPPSLPPSLIAWWKLDENSGSKAFDSSGNGADGDVSGKTRWANGLVFEGSGKVSLGTKASLEGEIDFAVHFWIKTKSQSTGAIIQQRSADGPSFQGYRGEWYVHMDKKGLILFVVYNSDYQFNFKAARAINDGGWHHVAVVRRQNTGEIYIGGELSAAQTSQKIESLDKRISMFMGFDGRDNRSFLNGTLRDVEIYSEAVVPSSAGPTPVADA